MDQMLCLGNQDTQPSQEVLCDEIILQNCLDHESLSEKYQNFSSTHPQFSSVCEDSQLDKQSQQETYQNSDPGLRYNFYSSEKSDHPPTSPSRTFREASPSRQYFLSPKLKQSSKTKKTKFTKKDLEQSPKEFQRNFKFQQKLFGLCFDYMNETVANKIAEESGIATDAFLKRKKQAERSQKVYEQFMQMMECSSNSSWSSIQGKKRRNWCRRVSKKDVKTVFEYLQNLNETNESMQTEINYEKIMQGQKDAIKENEEKDSEDLISHLSDHSVFIENLPPKIIYSELQKYLQSYGEINHFMILDHVGRRKRNDPITVEDENNKKRHKNWYKEQSKIIGFVEFYEKKSVEKMLDQMKDRRLRFCVIKDVTDKNPAQLNVEKSETPVLSKEGDMPLTQETNQISEGQKSRKNSIQSESSAVQNNQKVQQRISSRKIYARQVNWKQMLTKCNREDKNEQNKKKGGDNKLDISNINEESSEKQDDTNSVIEFTEQETYSQKNILGIKSNQHEDNLKKKENLEKLNMLRLKLKLFKSIPVKKEEEDQEKQRQIPSVELQSALIVELDQHKVTQDPQQIQFHQPNTEKPSNFEPIVVETHSKIHQISLIQQQEVINSAPFQQHVEQTTNHAQKLNKQSKQAQTDQTQTHPKSTQAPQNLNIFQKKLKKDEEDESQSQSQSPIRPIRRKKCWDCSIREFRKMSRSIQKQIHITVGANYSTEIPYTSALASFHQRKPQQQSHHSKHSKFPGDIKVKKEHRHNPQQVQQKIEDKIEKQVKEYLAKKKLRTLNKMQTEGITKMNAKKIDTIEIHNQDPQTLKDSLPKKIQKKDFVLVQNKDFEVIEFKKQTLSEQIPIEEEIATGKKQQKLQIQGVNCNSEPFTVKKQQIIKQKNEPITILVKDQQKRVKQDFQLKQHHQLPEQNENFHKPNEQFFPSHQKQILPNHSPINLEQREPSESSSSSSQYVAQCASPVQQPQKRIHEESPQQSSKPKSLFDYSLWDSQESEIHSQNKKQPSGTENQGKSLSKKIKLNKRLEQNGLNDHQLHFEQGVPIIEEITSPNPLKRPQLNVQEEEEKQKNSETNSHDKPSSTIESNPKGSQPVVSHKNPSIILSSDPSEDSFELVKPKNQSALINERKQSNLPFSKPQNRYSDSNRREQNHNRYGQRKRDSERYHGNNWDSGQKRYENNERGHRNYDRDFNKDRNQRETNRHRDERKDWGEHEINKRNHYERKQYRNERESQRNDNNDRQKNRQGDERNRREDSRKHEQSKSRDSYKKSCVDEYIERNQKRDYITSYHQGETSWKGSDRRSKDDRRSREEERREKFSVKSGTRHDQDKYKRDSEKDRRNNEREKSSKKWKYSEYMQEQISPARQNSNKSRSRDSRRY